MFDRAHSKSRFATPLHFAPTPAPTPVFVHVLSAVGLVAVGVGLGFALAPMVRRFAEQRRPLPKRSVPRGEIDRWANEGGATLPPAFPKAP